MKCKHCGSEKQFFAKRNRKHEIIANVCAACKGFNLIKTKQTREPKQEIIKEKDGE